MVHQVNWEEQVHTLWPVKFCPTKGANLFFLTCELSQWNKISSNQFNNFVINTLSGDIILTCWIKTHDSWVTRVDFLQASINETAVSAAALPKRNINDLHIELAHTSETITRSTIKGLGIQVTSTFKLCEDCTLGKAKQCAVSKKSVPC